MSKQLYGIRRGGQWLHELREVVKSDHLGKPMYNRCVSRFEREPKWFTKTEVIRAMIVLMEEYDSDIQKRKKDFKVVVYREREEQNNVLHETEGAEV